MNLYLDDNHADPHLAALLTHAGHTVTRPVDAGLTGASDARHLAHAIRVKLVVLTGDQADFRDLDELVLAAGGNHPGILIIRFENNPKKDMQPKHVVKALQKLEQSGLDLANQVVILNHWR